MRCFIDTNVLIHYKIFTEVNWIKEINEPSIELIICPTVLQELDRMKFSELNLDLRNRSKKIISKLSEYSGGKFIIENVTIHFIVNEPQIEWAKFNLSPDVADDRILATILTEGQNSNLLLISSDLGIKLKAQANGIRTCTLPDDLLIQVKKDKKEEELNKLKQRLAFLENRSPRLALKLLENETLSNFRKCAYDMVKPYDSNTSNQIIDDLRKELKYNPPKYENNIVLQPLTQLYEPSDEEISRYEKEVEKYLFSLKTYYEHEWEYSDLLSRTFEIKLVLVNEGSEPADDIDIHLHLPDGFTLFEKVDYPLSPKKPEEPERPRSFSEIFKNFNIGQGFTTNLFDPSIYIPRSPTFNNSPDTSPTIKKTNSYEVKYKIDKLKHRMNIELDPLFIYFENYSTINSFALDYTILASNCAEDFSGSLNLIFSY